LKSNVFLIPSPNPQYYLTHKSHGSDKIILLCNSSRLKQAALLCQSESVFGIQIEKEKYRKIIDAGCCAMPESPCLLTGYATELQPTIK
jgi:hypothetical protein